MDRNDTIKHTAKYFGKVELYIYDYDSSADFYPEYNGHEIMVSISDYNIADDNQKACWEFAGTFVKAPLFY